MSALVTLICLYSPKLYIIILHTEKNVRKLTMNTVKKRNMNHQNDLISASSGTSVQGQLSLPSSIVVQHSHGVHVLVHCVTSVPQPDVIATF